MMDFAFKMMNLSLKMMSFSTGEGGDVAAGAYVSHDAALGTGLGVE